MFLTCKPRSLVFLRTRFVQTGLIATVCLLLFAAAGKAQITEPPARVRFTLYNSSLKSRTLDIRCFDYQKRKRIGYGCRIGALASRSDNKPVGTRVYIKRKENWELALVLTAADDGRTIDITQPRKISREQQQQVAHDEQNEASAALENAAQNPDIASVARSKGLEMISFRLSGKTWLGKQVHVRVQLPYDPGRSNEGFSRKLSAFKTYRVEYPVGTKIYLCKGPYWNGPVSERLLLTVDSEKANYLLKI